MVFGMEEQSFPFLYEMEEIKHLLHTLGKFPYIREGTIDVYYCIIEMIKVSGQDQICWHVASPGCFDFLVICSFVKGQ